MVSLEFKWINYIKKKLIISAIKTPTKYPKKILTKIIMLVSIICVY